MVRWRSSERRALEHQSPTAPPARSVAEVVPRCIRARRAARPSAASALRALRSPRSIVRAAGAIALAPCTRARGARVRRAKARESLAVRSCPSSGASAALVAWSRRRRRVASRPACGADGGVAGRSFVATCDPGLASASNTSSAAAPWRAERRRRAARADPVMLAPRNHAPRRHRREATRARRCEGAHGASSAERDAHARFLAPRRASISALATRRMSGDFGVGVSSIVDGQSRSDAAAPARACGVGGGSRLVDRPRRRGGSRQSRAHRPLVTHRALNAGAADVVQWKRPSCRRAGRRADVAAASGSVEARARFGAAARRDWPQAIAHERVPRDAPLAARRRRADARAADAREACAREAAASEPRGGHHRRARAPRPARYRARRARVPRWPRRRPRRRAG